MSQLIPLRYQFDPTGVSSDNLIIEEEHIVSSIDAKLIILNEGLFYTHNFVLRTTGSGTPLVKGTDYEFVSLDPFITAQTGKETAGAIQLSELAPAGTFLATYQCVGGYEGRSNQLVLDLIAAIDIAKDGDIDWLKIRNKPTQYPPAYHTTELDSITGWEKLVNRLHELKLAILDTHSLGSSALTLKRTDERILALIAELQKDMGWLMDNNAQLYTLLESIMGRIKKLQQFDVDFGEIGQDRSNGEYDTLLVSTVDVGEITEDEAYGEGNSPE